jgi:hypothetical protein
MADGIPFTQAPAPPRFAEENPLQTMQQAQSMAVQGQAMQQQQLVNAAKMAVGQHMQAHIDPATGRLDNYNFIASVAKDPRAALAVGDVYHMLLENGEIDARTAGQRLSNEKAKLDIMGNSAAPYIQKMAEGKTTTDADIAGYVGTLVANKVFDNEKDAMVMLQGLTGSPVGTKNNRDALFRMLGQYNTTAQATLTNTMQSMEKRYEQVTGITPEGVPYSIPKARVPGMLPPGPGVEGGALLPEETAERGTSAPRSELPAGQEESPSAPPATTGVPRGAIQTGMAPMEAARQKPYLEYKEGKGWMNEAEKDSARNASLAYSLETKLKNEEELFSTFKQGPTRDMKMQLANFASGVLPGGAENPLVRALVDAPNSTIALSAAAALRKELAKDTFEQLKQAIGGQGRFTNFELDTMLKANYGLDTPTPAIERMMNDMRRVARIAKIEAAALEQYRKVSLFHPTHDDSFSQSFFTNKLRNKLVEKGLYKEGQIKLTKDGEVVLPSPEGK